MSCPPELEKALEERREAWTVVDLHLWFNVPTERSNVERNSLATLKQLASNEILYHDTSFRAQDVWLNAVQWDFEHHTRTFYTNFTHAEDYDAMHQSGCYQFWKEPLVDCFNDDGNTGARTSLQGYAAYGDQVFLQRAISIHNVSLFHLKRITVKLG